MKEWKIEVYLVNKKKNRGELSFKIQRLLKKVEIYDNYRKRDNIVILIFIDCVVIFIDCVVMCDKDDRNIDKRILDKIIDVLCYFLFFFDDFVDDINDIQFGFSVSLINIFCVNSRLYFL